MKFIAKIGDVARLVLFLMLFPVVLAAAIIAGVWVFICRLFSLVVDCSRNGFGDVLFVFASPFAMLKEILDDVFGS